MLQRAQNRTVILSLLALATSAASGADLGGANSSLWTLGDGEPARIAGADAWVQPGRHQTAQLSLPHLTALLEDAPHESAVALADSESVIVLPMPDGTMARFAFVASPVMAPALGAKYPEITTYVGRGIDDPAASVRFDITPSGFHAQVLSPNGAVYVDPLWRGDRANYASYYKRDLARRDGATFSCLTHQFGIDEAVAISAAAAVSGSVAGGTSGDTLRTYRLACAATGEYTNFHGGGVVNGLAAVVTAINRVTGIYEIELGIRLELVANNDLVIYTSPATDPYTNNDGFAMLTQNQSALNSVIGSSNYDIGHVFSTGGGGVAAFQAVCRNTSKAQGVTGLPSPIGDPFYVDFVAHEIGHQFGGSHSFNGTTNNCCCGNRSGSTAMEPGSGSTIMAYAGICGADNLQLNSDPYFHAISVQQISSYVQTGFGATCSADTATGNTSPTVSAGPNHAIPGRTPFALTATASDAESATLTYAWEEYDTGVAAVLSAPDNGSSPLFRSFDPTPDPTRTFPQLSHVLNGTSTTSEKLPTTSRSLLFRVTVRDNQAGGGGVEHDDTLITVDGGAGPFKVTAPTSADTWVGAGTVTWDVAGTDSGIVNTPTVNILLSTDGGLTFPTVLASDTPNDGSETVVVSTFTTSSARIKVEGAGNVFFNVNPGDFSIVNCSSAGAPLAESGGIDKNRYVAFEAPTGGGETAIQVRLESLPAPFDVFDGEVRWAGPPSEFADGVSGTFMASQLQCDPHFMDWNTVGLLHVYGEGLVPSGTYGVSTFACSFNVAGEPMGAGEPLDLTVMTRAWGDVVPPFAGEAPIQPDFKDIMALVQGFLDSPTSPGKVRAQLSGDSPDPAVAVSFLDVSDGVGAFLSEPYPYSGPLACP